MALDGSELDENEDVDGCEVEEGEETSKQEPGPVGVDAHVKGIPPEAADLPSVLIIGQVLGTNNLEHNQTS